MSRTYAPKLHPIPQKHPHYLFLTAFFALTITLVAVWLFSSGIIKLPAIGQTTEVKPQVTEQQQTVKSDVTVPAKDKPVNQAVVDNPKDQTTVSDVVKDAPKDDPVVTVDNIVKDEPKDVPKNNVVVPASGEILIVDTKYLKDAKFPVNKADDVRRPGINLTVPKGTEIYAPYDGVIGVGSASYTQEGKKINTLLVSIAKTDAWDPKSQFGPGTYRMDFMTNDFQRAKGIVNGVKVKKGQLLGYVGSEVPIFSDYNKNASDLYIAPLGSWAKDENLMKITDPDKYLREMISMAQGSKK